MLDPRILADTIVDDAQLEPGVVACRRHDDVTRRRPWCDAMSNGILHERLQHEVRHHRVPRIGIDSEAHLEAILKADLLNLDVVREQVQLLRERHLLLARAAQRHTQQLTQAGHDTLRRVSIGRYERSDGVERVEEKMRMELET